MSIWHFSKFEPQVIAELAAATGSQLIATVLAARGLRTADEARMFLTPSLSDLHDPFLMKDMDKAVTRLEQAIAAKEKVLVAGDYDVDGITSSALMAKVLTDLGVPTIIHLPTRRDGYGFRDLAIQKASAEGASLIITVDCGITAIAPVERAQELGIDVLITDHHEPHAELPRAFAILNPKLPDNSYPFRDLAGVGIALKLAQALWKRGIYKERFARLLELASLGTVADVAPLIGENRVIVTYGLKALQDTANLGLIALKTLAGLKPGQLLDGFHIGFILGPRMNAAGRLEDPDDALAMLLADNEITARDKAQNLNRFNTMRQELEENIVHQAIAAIEQQAPEARQHFIVVSGENWHEGVIGIVASRLVERYFRPVVVLSITGEVAKGSGRSIPRFNLLNALHHCSKLFLEYGGHAVAAGLSIPAAAIDAFRVMANSYAGAILTEELLQRELELIGEIALHQVSPQVVQELQALKPFGVGNPKPIFCFRGLRCVEPPRRVGVKGKHLRLVVTNGQATIPAIGFGFGNLIQLVRDSAALDIAASLELNEWMGAVSVQLNLRDLKPTTALEKPED